jgi:TolB-like protein/Flp pilus assembly protein TadD
MELVEGETLEALVRREGSLKVELALGIAIQVTRALIAAAAQNLVHRDLKPANIMLMPNEARSEELEVKVIDFGLAKVTAETANEKDITHGAFVGTPAFASPEQFRGQPADARSDIYSLGATLWYSLTGELPCSGNSIEEIRRSQTEMALPVAQLTARKIPKSVIALLRRTLAVDPAQRPASPRQLLAELEACHAHLAGGKSWSVWYWAAAIAVAVFLVVTFFLLRPLRPALAPVAFAEKSIAVLPFENRSSDKENAFFTDGVQDEILTDLARIADLKVISRTSVMRYKSGVARDMREIGKQLGVAHLVEGSVQRTGGKVRVNAQLVDARTDTHLWAQTYDRDVADVFAMQSEIAQTIAGQLQAKILPNDKGATKLTQNPEAWLLYLRARERETGYAKGDADILAADQLYAEAIALDPNFALARARRSILNSKGNTAPNAAHPSEQKLVARREAEEALRSAPDLGEAHLALAYYFFLQENDPASALKELVLAESTAPNNAELFWIRGAAYRQQGHWREAIASYQRAQELDPRNSEIAVLAARNYKLVRDWPNAEKALMRALEIEPSSGQVLLFLTGVQWWAGNANAFHAVVSKFPPDFEPLPDLITDQAMIDRDFAKAEKTLQQFKDGEQKTYLQGYVALARGDEATAHRVFELLRPRFETRARDHPDDAFAKGELGLLYAYLGRKEEAIRECRQAIEVGRAGNDPFLETPLLEGKLALVYARSGEIEQAMTLLQRLLVTPGAVTTSHWSCTPSSITLMDLRQRWEWDPLRSDPRFQKIVAGPEPKTVY